jgi:riboflavin synthase
MFTGIVEQMGEIRSSASTAEGRRIEITAEGLEAMPIGASISVNGVCLTAVETDRTGISVDVIPETLERTNLGSLDVGDRVNLERAMPADGRFDGHIVQGHVDGVGKIESVAHDDGAVTMSVSVDDSLGRYLVEKGSVTIDGVSLTIAGTTDAGFSVALIPHTLEVTNLGLRNVGDRVNLEIDVLAKYVERLMR